MKQAWVLVQFDLNRPLDKMKFAAIVLLALIAAVCAAPTSISDNNIGNVVNVGISGSLNLKNEVNQDIVSVIIALLNQQAIVVGLPDGIGPDGAEASAHAAPPKFQITPEAVERLKSMLAAQ